ncbi:DoxX family protein [Alkalilimnicola sp. S0819]|uniref:DoxX family protein n=1 Tax=Alkalilimnicola sp. S0819 TaxID=2613922 RepID=UPI001261A6A7|nr:DoxX family protein [Alkalilimnicola sp. S0819]KAB7622660.1 hypothetical protein F3N43_12380 [Alkalilimnicola sp. S0819]MPQ17431.1 hypothetical protein [Alkalilimnicola sp. S0819]
MSFLLLMMGIGAVSWVVQLLGGRGRDLRLAMRNGMAGGFLFTGIDHFVNDTSRYLPMMPEFFGSLSLPLVWFTGAAELAGAVGLLLPLAWYRRLGLPNLRYWAGIGLALLLSLMVIANINVAIRGSGVAGLEFGAWYFWLRPLFQPFIIAWALYAAGVLARQSEAANGATIASAS